MIYLCVPGSSGAVSIAERYREKLGIADHSEVRPYETAPADGRYRPGAYVFTGFGRLGSGGTALAAHIHRGLAGQPGFEVLNDPVKSLRRYELLDTLYKLGLNQFRAFGAWEDLSDAKFPVFLRDRSRDGGVFKLLHSRRELESHIGKYLMDGRDLDQLLAVEFLDTSDEDGFFRKYSAYVLGSQILAADMNYGLGWVLRAHSSEFTWESVEEEGAYLLENPHEDQIRNIFDIANLHFGRIDYGILDGRVQTWEINTLPVVGASQGGSGPVEPLYTDAVAEDLRELRVSNKRAANERLAQAFQELAGREWEGEGVLLDVPESVRAPALAEIRSMRGPTYPGKERFGALRWLLRPLKPVLKPLAARTLQPLMSWASRRAARRR